MLGENNLKAKFSLDKFDIAWQEPLLVQSTLGYRDEALNNKKERVIRAT